MQGLFGKLTINAFIHDRIEASVGVSMAMITILLIFLLTYTKRWKWLWREWLTSLDHKKIGIMYLVFSSVMLV